VRLRAPIEQETTVELEKYGWNDRCDSIFSQFRHRDLLPARIVRVDRGLVAARTNRGTANASIPGSLDPAGETGPVAVGDWVALDPSNNRAVVRAILPRVGVISRRQPGPADREQVVAANVDLVLVLESLERGPNPGRIERATTLAWDGGATPIVVLTKSDICPDLETSLVRAGEGAPFCDVVPVSSVTGDGIQELTRRLTSGTTAVLLGASGVGKSTLTNLLLGEEKFAVADVRASDGKGRHTTTSRELVSIPGGACLIDTPGVRELGLWLAPDAVDSAFPEISEAASGCRFGDCRHESEPECAVLSAIEKGVIDPRRLASFHRLRREVESLDLRRDASRRHEVRARERSFGKMAREAIRRKNNR
jgi:ribosome biogenesis GTPase